jgi:hypothetical protein
MTRRRSNVPQKIHQDDREVLGFFQSLLDYQRSLVPTGVAVRNFALTVPDGYLSCNGATFSATEYPNLATALGGTTLPVQAGFVIKT